MRQVFLLTLLNLLLLASFAQDKKDLAVSVSAGYFNSNYYFNAHSRGFYGFGFDYYLAERHLLSAGYIAGSHDYFDSQLSNTPGSVFIINPKGTNATADYNTFSIAYKYKAINGPSFNLTPGAGAGILTHTRTYPYTNGNRTDFETSSWSDLVFPITLEASFTVLKRWQLGLTTGFLIHPDYPVLGWHAGPKLAYVIK